MSCNTKSKCNFNHCGCDFSAKIFGSFNPKNIILDASSPNTLNWTEISVPEILCVPKEKPDIEHIDQVHAKAEVNCVKLLETPFAFEPTIYNVPQIDGAGAPITLPNSATIAIAEENVTFYLAPLTTIPNAEGTALTGRKLIVEGTLKQKIVYTANVSQQSVHSANYEIPFSAFIIPYTNIDTTPQTYTVIDPADVTAVVTISAYDADNFEINLCEDFCVDAFIEDIYISPLDCRTMFKNVTLFLQAKPVPQCGGNLYTP